MRRNKLSLLCAIISLILLIIALIDLCVYDIPFIYANVTGITLLILSLVLNAINYFKKH